MDTPTVSPYPGFDRSGQYLTPRKAPRVKPEAEEYASRNLGTTNIFSSEHYEPIVTPSPSPRCPSYEARDNYQRSRGQVAGLLGGSGPAVPLESAPAPRVRPEAQSIAENHLGRGMSEILASSSQASEYAQPVPRVKVEAADQAELARGQRMGKLLHNPDGLPATARCQPRVKPEAAEIAHLGAGPQMNKIMNKYGETPRSSRPVPRVKQEAAEMASMDRGGRMQNLLNSYGKLPESARPVPRVRDGLEYASLDQGGRMSRLMHEGDTLPGDLKPPPRAPSSSGRRNVRKGKQGTVSQVFAETAKWQIVTKPGIRSTKGALG
ncbi:uncharacterized protein LOC112555145 [Pomacea canaliculata]|nr:uncharacterized protein LOC112555145 [Pomacea canaliculata]